MGGGSSKNSQKKIAEVYKLLEAIGRGSFATVYEGELLPAEKGRLAENGQPIPSLVAVKVIDKRKIPPEEICLLQEECTIMQKLDHPNCVSLLESFDENDYFYIVLELVKGGELFDQIVARGYFNEIEAAHATKQVAQALAYIEDQGVVHRDIKPENLIYESNETDARIKLTDFGLAKDISTAVDKTKALNDPCGTPGYVAPEILHGAPYGHPVDVWALGIVLFILLCGYPPFYSEDQSELFEQIKAGDVRFDDPYWTEVSPAAKQLITKLLQVHPEKRLTAKQLLEEPWVSDPESNKAENFGDHVIEGIKEVQKRKLKRAIFKIKAMNGMKNAASAFGLKKDASTLLGELKAAAEQSKAEKEEGEVESKEEEVEKTEEQIDKKEEHVEKQEEQVETDKEPKKEEVDENTKEHEEQLEEATPVQNAENAI